MKKFFAFILICFLVGCGKQNVENLEGKISIVATIFPPYDFARQIAADNAEITMLLPPATESHSYEPTPQDIIKIAQCDVFIYVDGESDEWVRDVLSSIDTSKMQIITLMDCVVPVEEELKEGMQTNSEFGEEGIEYDEHVWTSPKNAKLIVQKISTIMQQVDQANAAIYRANTISYLAKLDELDEKFLEVVKNGTRKTLIFGDRFPFRYFADSYGLDYFAAFLGCATETEASARTVKFLVDKVREENIPVIFTIELSNGKIARTIAEQTAATVLELHSAHNVTRDEFARGIGYYEIMLKNVDALKEAL